MGCDIHNIWEALNPETGDWEAIYVSNPDEWETKRLKWRTEDRKEAGMEIPKGVTLEYNGRNYNVFAILANVRNGRGTAGCKTGEGFEPLTKKRGVPDDASPEFREMSEAWGVDGHSHTWVTLAELLDTGWQLKTTMLYGIISSKEYIAWREKNAGVENPEGPGSYCGGVSGPRVHVITDISAEKLIAELGELPESVSHVQVHWGQTYAESAKWFMEFVYSKVMPLTVGKGMDPNNVRMCMFFDN